MLSLPPVLGYHGTGDFIGLVSRSHAENIFQNTSLKGVRAKNGFSLGTEELFSGGGCRSRSEVYKPRNSTKGMW